MHESVSKSKLKPGRLIIVGDVHGCAAELQQLLQQVQYTQEQDNLIFVGDLVNKGPKSIEVGRPTQGATQGADCAHVSKVSMAGREHGSAGKGSFVKQPSLRRMTYSDVWHSFPQMSGPDHSSEVINHEPARGKRLHCQLHTFLTFLSPAPCPRTYLTLHGTRCWTCS